MDDLLQILQAHAPIDLATWSHSWLESAGRPSIRSAVVTDTDGSVRIDLASDPGYTQQLDVAVGCRSHIEHHTIRLSGQASFSVDRTGDIPEFVLPNGLGLGYGEFVLDESSLSWLTGHLPTVSDPLTRGSAWLTLWDAVLAGRIAPENLIDLAIAAVPVEESELNLQRMLHDVERLFWVFVPLDTRAARSTLLEAALQRRLDTARSVTMKAAAFAGFRAIATTLPAIEWLRALWSHAIQIDDLRLSESDDVAIAKELAVRAAMDDETIGLQVGRTESRDLRDALSFVAPALSADASTRDAFFHTIADASNRRREPWVIEGMRWLNHPLRADASKIYIRPALDLLEDVKRTGDIFLPKRWLDALLGGHRSPEATLIVREFLATRPESYPLPLRRMVLASADQLFRSSRQSSKLQTNTL